MERIQYSFVPNHRDTMEALAHARFSNQEFRVVISLLNQTNGYLREEDRLSLAFWSRLTGMSPQHLCHAISRLRDKNVISRNGVSYRVNRPAQWSPGTLKTLPEQATKPKARVRSTKGNALPLQATVEGQQSQPLPRPTLPEQATPVAQTGNLLLPEQAMPPDTNQIGSKENSKENSLKKTGDKVPVAPRRGRAPPDAVKPFQREAGAFLDWASSQEKVKFPNRGKLMYLVRRTLAATQAAPEDLQEWYCWVKENDRYWRAREPPVIIAKAPEKFPTWFRDKKEGRSHEQSRGWGGQGLPEPGGDPLRVSRQRGVTVIESGPEPFDSSTSSGQRPEDTS